MATVMRAFNEMRDDWPTDQIAAKQWLEERIQRMEKEGVFAEVIRLTPALAKEFQAHNADNRPIRTAKLRQIIDEINAGRYMLNGETVIFADTGEMNDGQHRCQAVVETMRAVETVIVFGVSRPSRRTVDNGANRSPGDHLSVEGFTYGNDMGSVARFVLAWERSKKQNLTAMNRIAPTAIVDRGMDDARIHESAKFGRTHYTKAPVAAPSVIGFAYYAFAAIDQTAAEEYLKGVIYGANLDPNSAMYQVREHLLALDRKVREHRVEYLFAGFVAHRAGLPLGKYRIRNTIVSLTGDPQTTIADAAAMELPLEVTGRAVTGQEVAGTAKAPEAPQEAPKGRAKETVPA